MKMAGQTVVFSWTLILSCVKTVSNCPLLVVSPLGPIVTIVGGSHEETLAAGVRVVGHESQVRRGCSYTVLHHGYADGSR